MALSDTTSNIIARAITNLNNIKQAIIDMGVDVTNKTSDDYAESILDINILNGTTLTVSPSTSAQTFTPSSPYNGYTEVNVSEATLEEITVTPSVYEQVITPSEDNYGISQVTVEAVDSSIDSNIIASNILDGVTILGVEGTLVGGSINTIEQEVQTGDYSDSSPVEYTFVIDTNVDGITINNRHQTSYSYTCYYEPTSSRIALYYRASDSDDYTELTVDTDFTLSTELAGSSTSYYWYYDIDIPLNTFVYDIKIVFTGVYRVSAQCIYNKNVGIIYSESAPSNTNYDDGTYWYVYEDTTIDSNTYRNITTQYVLIDSVWTQIT